MSNLHQSIRTEIENGRLNSVFSPKQVYSLRREGDFCWVGENRYLVSSIREILANQSIGPGDRVGESVKRGMQTLFVKQSRAQYCLIDNDSDLSVTSADGSGENGKNFAESVCNGKENRDEIAKSFVEYLRNKPFRIAKNIRNGLVWYPEDGAVTGWPERLNAYEWNGSDWQATEKRLSNISNMLMNLMEDISGSDQYSQPHIDRAKNIYLEIIKWGNPKGTARNGSFVLKKLTELERDDVVDVDSTLTKLYALAKPHEYVIYDSRVATAIISIAEDIFRIRNVNQERIDTIIYFRQAYGNLGKYPGAGGTRPRGFRCRNWPIAYMKPDAQTEANDLCRRILKILNSKSERGRSNWTLREIEAVLFMEGY